MRIKKRSGHNEQLNIEKIHKVVSYACQDISGVSESEVELNSQIQFYDSITTTEIQETLIKSAADLISEDAPNYQFVAGRLINYHLRKQIYRQFNPPHLYDIIKKNIKLGFYDEAILIDYNKEEIDQLDKIVDHSRDENLTYAAMEQFRGKYLVKNRSTGEILETPQIAYILIAATLFSQYPKENRLKYVKDYYNAVSRHKISLPTPIMAGVRTPQRQFSSCVLIDCDDSLDSINATSSAIVRYVSQRAGIGINGGGLRAIGSPIRGGQATHTGVIPFWKMFQAAVRSCSQGGVRNGAATLFFPVWHLEYEDLVVLKNNKGIEDNRIRHMDYGIQFNKLMYERLIDGGNITLFSPNDVPGMYDAFFNDQDKFKELYETAEKNPKIRKKTLTALEVFSTFMQERKDTGRIYAMNVDHCNSHGSFIEEQSPIKQSNLCMEITLPTQPLNDISDTNGSIPLCTLSAINWGAVKDPSEFENLCNLAVRALDAILDYQDYPVEAAEICTMKFRPLGVGIINFAYWLAKNDTNYQDPNLELIDEWMEAMAYYLTKASADLAVEKGACEGIENTKYGIGITPNQTYKKEVDTLVKNKERMDWKSLRKQLKETGIRNSTLMALMPSETSSIVANATNGVEPPRALVSVKQSKDGIMRQVVPAFAKMKNKYDLLWEQKSPEGYLKICAVLQKYIDQSISTNTSYNPIHYEDEKIPMSLLLGHLLMCYRYGIKTLYYFQTHDGQGEIKIEEECESCKI